MAKYLKLYGNIQEAVGQVVKTPVVAQVRGFKKAAYGLKRELGEDAIVVKRDSYISFKTLPKWEDNKLWIGENRWCLEEQVNN